MSESPSKEEDFSLPLGDGHLLYGRINRAAAQPARKAIVLCHGLTGNMDELQYQKAQAFFTKRGYDVIRFNFYGDQPDARHITDSTVAQQAKDFERVLQHFRPQYKSLCAAGHSFGGLTILMANSPLLDAATLWDGTFIPFAEDKYFSSQWSYDKERGDYVVHWPPLTKLVGKNFYDETKTFTSERMKQWAEKFTGPVQVIAAGAFAENLPYQKKLFETLASARKEYTAIASASHQFSEGTALQELFERTNRWLETALAPGFNSAARKVDKAVPVATPVRKLLTLLKPNKL